ncbi:pyridoxamine 5'-phosphate oxidase [Mobilisporobacter senegalensis]|uniref:Pyridoxamine 5'-phosphate oxidase n=1 Tax=Mobilisporobacter senegalensis TaxID=1329262 RepID=A0A3N1XTU2_9FIRM|nr:pyridoxamine 5'-phosphate oxidase family protein [Mobilisporobacter senegalensis]ROR28592.1 pyridoxamine 5'-phosphate oxidase [Mobilisporobacter senegalensis]
MDFLKEFDRIMETTNEIALATSIDNMPNVRIVNFYYDTLKNGIIYFATFKNCTKIQEFDKNNKIALTTIPHGSSEQIRIGNGTVQKSELTIFDLKDVFVKKLPNYEAIIEQAGRALELYEIHFNEASVILDIDKRGKINF